jgi:hypothetical protein
MRWATRPCCHVDRTACAWLIRRFIDQDAEFVFVGDLDDVPPDATPFDMRGVEFGHVDGDCSFERLLAGYELSDPALRRLADIVHEADIGDERYHAPEAAGIDLAVRALAIGRTDEELIAQSFDLYEGIYLVFASAERETLSTP